MTNQNNYSTHNYPSHNLSTPEKIYIYIDYLHNFIVWIDIAITEFMYYCSVTKSCDNIYCYMEPLNTSKKLDKIDSKLTDIRLDFCYMISDNEETIERLKEISKELTTIQKALKSIYKTCEKYIEPVSGISSEEAIKKAKEILSKPGKIPSKFQEAYNKFVEFASKNVLYTTSGQSIYDIKRLSEDPIIEEFVYGNLDEAVSSIIEFYNAYLPEHLNTLQKIAKETCPAVYKTKNIELLQKLFYKPK